MKCIVNNCKSKISKSKTTSYAAHLKLAHKEAYEKVLEDSKNLKRIKNPKNNGKLNIDFKKEDLIKAIVWDAACAGVSFNYYKKSSTHNQIIVPVAKALGLKKKMNKENVKKLVHLAAEHMRKKMIEEFSNRVIHIKTDLATRNRRSLMGVNVQYCDKGKITVRSLSVYQLNSNATSENLREIIKKVDYQRYQ